MGVGTAVDGSSPFGRTMYYSIPLAKKRRLNDQNWYIHDDRQMEGGAALLKKELLYNWSWAEKRLVVKEMM